MADNQTVVAKQPKRQMRKFLPLLVMILSTNARDKRPSDIEKIVTGKPFGFAGIKEFCQWLASGVTRLDNPTNSDGSTNKQHGTPLHNYAKAVLGKVKAKYADHAEYFETAGNTNANILGLVATQLGLDADESDPETIGDSLGDI